MCVPWWRWNETNSLLPRITHFGWSDQPVRAIQCLPRKLSRLHWIQIVSTQGSPRWMVGVPFDYISTSAKGQLSCPDRSKLFLHQNYLSLVSRSGHPRVTVGLGWGLLERKWLSCLLGVHPHPISCVGWSWPTPSWRSLAIAFFSFIWNCISHQWDLRECSLWQLWELWKLWGLGWPNLESFPVDLRLCEHTVLGAQFWLVFPLSSGDFCTILWCGHDLYDRHTFGFGLALSDMS